jgi:TM2 domain-containing membrane protein YozV
MVVYTIVICQNCGKNTPEGKFCEHCGASVESAQVSGQPSSQQLFSPQQPGSGKTQKNAGIAALLSLIPGLGQMYNEQIVKGIGLFFIVAIGYSLYPLIGLIVHIAVMYDGYSTAKKINNGEIS